MTSTLSTQEVVRSRSRAGLARLRWGWLFLVIAAFAIYPALTNNIAALAYDAGTVHLYRSYVFSGAISDGVLYPRWVQFLHLGLGSPLFTFNPPLPYYALDLLYRLGLPQPLGWRLLIAGGLLVAGAGAAALAFLLTRSRWAALVAGVAYLYAPYVLRNALERGSLETFSMFLYPWVLWGLLRLARRPTPGRFVVATLFWAACIGSHVLGPLMLAPLAGLLALVAGWRYRTWTPLLALLAGGLLTAAIWLPIVPEQSWVRLDLNFENNDLATPLKHPVPLDRLLALPVVYDILRGNNGSGDLAGLPQVLLLLLGVPATIYAWLRRRRDLAVYLGVATLAGCLLFWLLTSASDSVWRAFEPILIRLEFRTRWMGLEALAAALVAGLIVALLPGRWQRYLAAGVAVILVLAVLPSLYVGLQHPYASFGDSLSWNEVRAAEIASGGTAFTSWNEFAPVWRRAPMGSWLQRELGPNFDPAVRPVANPPAGLTVTHAQVLSSAWDLSLHASSPVSATLNLFYYPRWQARLDGRPVSLTPQPVTGLTQVALPAGEHRLTLAYGLTTAESAGLVISGLTLIALLALTVLAFRRTGSSMPTRGQVQSPDPTLAEHSTPHPSGRDSVPAPMSGGDSAPSWWLLGGLTLLLAVKVVYVDPDTTWFRCVSTAEHTCGVETTASAPFEGGPRLIGYTVVTPQLRAGGEVIVNVAWQTDTPVTARLLSFLHVRNSQKDMAVNPQTGSEIWIQEDNPTPGGLLATEFLPGKVYIDEFRVAVPAGMPSGTYFLEVGWSKPDGGEQLDIRPAAVQPPLKVLWRSVLLPSVQVR
jgi:hypothetical protein